jgi:hypothetical protein
MRQKPLQKLWLSYRDKVIRDPEGGIDLPWSDGIEDLFRLCFMAGAASLWSLVLDNPEPSPELIRAVEDELLED